MRNIKFNVVNGVRVAMFAPAFWQRHLQPRQWPAICILTLPVCSLSHRKPNA